LAVSARAPMAETRRLVALSPSAAVPGRTPSTRQLAVAVVAVEAVQLQVPLARPVKAMQVVGTPRATGQVAAVVVRGVWAEKPQVPLLTLLVAMVALVSPLRSPGRLSPEPEAVAAAITSHRPVLAAWVSQAVATEVAQRAALTVRPTLAAAAVVVVTVAQAVLVVPASSSSDTRPMALTVSLPHRLVVRRPPRAFTRSIRSRRTVRSR
jgi:hypothetical protein